MPGEAKFDPLLGKLRIADLTQAEYDAIIAQLSNLENNELKITYSEIVTGTSGTLSTPSGATIQADEFGESGDAVLSQVNQASKPTYESPTDSSGNPVTVTLTPGTGDWTTSAAYIESSVMLIYVITIKAIDLPNLAEDSIIGFEQIERSIDSSYIEYYMTANNTDTVIATIDTMTKVAGVTTLGEASSDWTHSDNKVIYTGVKKKKVKVTATTTTVRATGSGEKLGRFCIFHNGVEVTKTFSGSKDVGTPTEITFQGIVELQTNDYIEMFVENKTDDEDFTVKNMMVIIIEINI